MKWKILSEKVIAIKQVMPCNTPDMLDQNSSIDQSSKSLSSVIENKMQNFEISRHLCVFFIYLLFI